MTTICVVGLGKMGLPIAALFASRGNSVIGADINQTVVDTINAGLSPIENEPGLDEMIQTSVAQGHLRATTQTTTAVRGAAVVIVLVPLLVDPANDYAPTYTALESAMTAIGAGIQPGTLVILETTVPVGDTRNRFGPIIEATSGLRAGQDFHLVFSPERVQSNHVIHNLQTYPKVMGGVNPASTAAAVQFYQECLTTNIIAVADCETAEFSKIAECVYRDVNIALANELAMNAGEIGIDINEVIMAANSEPLSHIHRPGLGVGGHCIPVYPYFLINRQAATQLASSARAINDHMADYAVTLLTQELGALAGKQVLLLGLAYRANVKEPTFSSALLVIAALKAAGATVIVHDPLFSAAEIERYAVSAADPELRDLPPLDAIIIQAWHDGFAELDWRQFAGSPLVLDGRNAVSAATVTAAGLRYQAIGRSTHVVSAPVS